jgi:hypothetical protein
MAASHTADNAPLTRRERRERRTFAPGPGMVVGIVATAGLVVSMFMAWQSHSVHPSSIPAAFLWDRHATGDPSFLIYLIPLAALLGIGSVLPGGRGLRLIAGLLAMAVVGVYAYQLYELTHSFGASFRDALEPGFYVAAVSAIVGFISGFVPTTVGSRRVTSVDTVDGDRY